MYKKMQQNIICNCEKMEQTECLFGQKWLSTLLDKHTMTL